MINIEEQLKKLPKAKLSRQADYIIRLKLYRLFWQKRFAGQKFYQPKFAPVLGLFLFMLIAVPAYAYFNPSVNSSHFLFPVKTTIEQVELGLSFSPVAKYQTLEKITGKRLAELEKLSAEPSQAKTEAIINTVKAAIDYNQEADNELSKISNIKDLQAAKKIVNNFKADYKNHLEQSASNIGVKANDEILGNISLALDRFSDRTDDRLGAVDKLWQTSTTRKHGFIINNNKNSTSVEDKLLTTENGQNQNISETSLDAARQQLAATEKNINQLKKDLPDEKYQADDVKILVNKLNDKIKKARGALESGDLKKSDELIKTTKAITNNARYFIRKNKDKNDKRNKTATTTPDEASVISTSTDQVDEQVTATTSQEKSFEKKTDNKDNWKKYDNDRRD